MMRKTKEQWIVLISFIIMLSVNALANILPINGKTTGELSDQYPNLFVPAAFTFAIWGLIYFLLGAFVVYYFRRQVKGNASPVGPNEIGVLFILSNVLNSLWILAWHFQLLGLSVVIMVAILITLIGIYAKLQTWRTSASMIDKRFAHLPFSVYLGWINVATIANVTALLVEVNWDRLGMSEVFWTVVMIAVATGLTGYFVLIRRDIPIGLVLMWTLGGIVGKRITADPIVEGVVIVAMIALLSVAAMVVTVFFAERRSLYQQT